jgi:sugar (pentulose or hexulose) kinase
MLNQNKFIYLGSKQDIEGFKEFVGKEEKIPTLTEKAEKVAKPKKDIIFTPFNDLENLPKENPVRYDKLRNKSKRNYCRRYKKQSIKQ